MVTGPSCSPHKFDATPNALTPAITTTKKSQPTFQVKMIMATMASDSPNQYLKANWLCGRRTAAPGAVVGGQGARQSVLEQEQQGWSGSCGALCTQFQASLEARSTIWECRS